MTYRRDKRKRNLRREKEHPERFVAGVAAGTWSHYEQGPKPDADKKAGRLERFHSDEEFLASLAVDNSFSM